MTVVNERDAECGNARCSGDRVRTPPGHLRAESTRLSSSADIAPGRAPSRLHSRTHRPMSDQHVDKKRKMSPAPDAEHSTLAPVSQLLVKKHSEKARLPTRGSPLSAGYDLYRCVFCTWTARAMLTEGIVLRRRWCQRTARPSLTRKFLSRYLRGRMVASRRVVGWVSPLNLTTVLVYSYFDMLQHGSS